VQLDERLGVIGNIGVHGSDDAEIIGSLC